MRGKARQAGRGMAGHGRAGQGRARQGAAGAAWLGKAGPGVARQAGRGSWRSWFYQSSDGEKTMAIYKIKEGNGDGVRLVDAPNAAAALRFVARKQFVVDVAKIGEVAELVAGGVRVEKAAE